ncbi:MAG: hypothetical protein ACHQF0_00765 [Chitinophagales bacterium]
MAINKNHEFEELNGVKCAIVEKNASAERVAFLKQLLEFNKYTVIVVSSPAPKPVAAQVPKPAVTTEANAQSSVVTTSAETSAIPPAPQTFTLGVTDVTFNPTNAIFGRLLHTKDGHVVTLAYWHQEESVSHDEVPYYEKNP